MRVRSRVGKAYMYKTKQDDVTTQHPQMVVSDVIITEYQWGSVTYQNVQVIIDTRLPNL